jgi:hypothetical protein
MYILGEAGPEQRPVYIPDENPIRTGPVLGNIVSQTNIQQIRKATDYASADENTQFERTTKEMA